MKKIIRLSLLLIFLPISAFASDSYMYIKVCNILDSYGPAGGPLHHNIEYVVKPQGPVNKTENLSATLSWSGNDICKDALIYRYNTTNPYPLSAELTIIDQQTQIVLWHGIVSKDNDGGDLHFSNQTREIDDQGNAVYFSYFPSQISVQRY